MRFRHGLLAIAFTILIATGIGLGATLVGNQSTQAHGPDRNNGAHPEHHESIAYKAGSRCVKTIWADYPYDGYNHAAYTQGPRKGTYPVASVQATADWINEDLGWEVRVKWTAPRYGLESNSNNNKRWACQPHTYIIQRSLNGSAWTDFASRRRDPATVRSGRRIGVYGPNTAFSTDELVSDEPATRSPVRYRVCGRLKNETTNRSCVTSNTVYVGGPSWEPRITAENLGPIVMTEGQQHSVSIPVTANPAPPAEFTSSALRSQQVQARFTQPDDQGVECPTGSIDNQTQNVYFDADGNGTFTLQNPLSGDNAFTDDCQFKYSVGDHHSESTIYIKEDDQWPIALNATTDEINASDGTVTSRFEIEFTGANGCPALAGVKIPVTASKSGRVEDDDFTVLSPIKMGDGDCTTKTAVNVSWEPDDETSTTSNSHGYLTARTKTSAAKNTYDQSNVNIPSRYDSVTFTDTRTIIQFQSSSHSVPAENTVSMHLQPQCAAGTTGAQVNIPHKVTNDANPTQNPTTSQARYIPTANCFAEPIMYTPKRDDAGQRFTAELTGIPAGTTTTRILTSRKTSTIYVQADATTIIVSPSTIRMSEGRTGTTVYVRLSAQPTHTVKVSFQDGAKYTVTNDDPDQNSGDPLFFTSVNWNAYKNITVSPKQDQDEDDEQGTITLTVNSTPDPRYRGERATIDYSITDDDEIARIRLSSFARPIFYADSDGNTDETAGHDDDAYVKISARFPARNTDPCYIEYISLTIKGTGLKTHFGHNMANPVLNEYPLYVPFGDNPGRHWTITQKSGYREYKAPSWDGLMFHHYDDETTDSEFIYHDNTPGNAKEGSIKSYALGSATRCPRDYFITHIVDLPNDGSYPTLDPAKDYGPYHRVNFPVE